ncbi:Gfo/Idh/MocA family protein [Gracilibacillus marinus]|uniref:Gfo/Idh/MocA family protein n=1 Tax=Gracilibacillus marinus TaxID=630535 RepID=A0ABV8VTP3_9BACI
MKIGIISFAHMHALSYARALQKNSECELTCIWDNNTERGEEMATTFQTTYYDNLEEMLRTDIDAVIVCSENVYHKEHVLLAAKAKKHILCEKPIATEIRDAEEMIAACEENNVLLQVAFPVRFAPPIQEMKRIIEEKALGNILAIRTTNHGQMPGGWFVDPNLSGGGCATDHIVHIVDVLRWVLQDEVKDVSASFDTRFYDIPVEDCGLVSLTLESGILVTIDPSWSRPKTFPTWGDVTLEFFGESGSLKVDAFKQHLTYYNDINQKIEDIVYIDDMDEGLINDFVTCVKQNKQPFITGEDGKKTLEVVKACYKSNQLKDRVSVL